MNPRRRTYDLCKGRWSAANARYFVTCCVNPGTAALTNQTVGNSILQVIKRLSETGDWQVFGATLMPDHFHIVFELGTRLSLSRVVAKFKALSQRSGICWQRNFFERRLRTTEQPGSYVRYVFMNPYRAGLIKCTEEWPWWYSDRELKSWDFGGMLHEGKYPPTVWLQEIEDVVTEDGNTIGPQQASPLQIAHL